MDMKQTLFKWEGREDESETYIDDIFCLKQLFHRSLQQRYEGFSNSREEHCDRCRRRSRSCRNDLGGEKGAPILILEELHNSREVSGIV